MKKYLKPTLEVFHAGLETYMEGGTLAMSVSVVEEADAKQRPDKEEADATYATGNIKESSYGDIW